MSAQAIDIRNAVADYVEARRAAGAFSHSFDVRRLFFTRHAMESTSSTQLFIYPTFSEISGQWTREDYRRVFTMTLDLVNFLDDQNEQAEIEKAIELAEELEFEFESDLALDMANSSLWRPGTADEPRPILLIDDAVERNSFHVVLSYMYSTILEGKTG